MRKFVACIALAAGLSLPAMAQDKKLPPVDPSPMDMAYYPAMYPYVVKVKGEPGTLVARVVYSRPQKKGRTIFGDLVEYNKVWRCGANEATEVEFFRPVTIGGKAIPKGRYTVYAIPGESKWTMIINKQTDIWGAYKYEQTMDVVRTEVTADNNADETEAFTMAFEKASQGANLVMAWDKTRVTLPIRWTDAAPAKPAVKKAK